MLTTILKKRTGIDKIINNNFNLLTHGFAIIITQLR